MTVVIAFLVNVAVGLAKTLAALLTGSASMMAEAAHSWADVGNETLLLVADRRKKGGPNDAHPLGYGREAYIWSMIAALGLFTAGGVFSVMRGFEELVNPEPGGDYTIAYIVLAVAFVLEGVSFGQAFWRTRREAEENDRDVLEHALITSDPTLRAVFAEDSAALIGLVLAAAGVGLHELTGSSVFDALGSILIGILLGAIGIVLVDRNRRFLVGQSVPERIRRHVIDTLTSYDEVERITFLMMEFIGPHASFVVARVDIVGDEAESHVAETLHQVEHRLEDQLAFVSEAVLSISKSDAPAIDG